MTVSLGRRKVDVDDARAWVFNRMASVYDARPPYPAPLVDAIAALTPNSCARVVDLGAGIGHLALPLAERGFVVTAVEPAIAMLERLAKRAGELGLALRAVHAKAESVPLPAASAELVVIADALHFLDAELSAHEVARLLVAGGALALITCEPADTPFMNALSAIMHEAAPRRPRATASPLLQLAKVASVVLSPVRVFHDTTPVSSDELERILRSISYLGPAMNPSRFSAFCQRVHALPDPAWARTFRLHAGLKA
jgi:ubiquinone/menaquinone biosynthesis C-methylase UbiE